MNFLHFPAQYDSRQPNSTTWIFFISRPSMICVSPTGVVYSLSPPRCRLSSSRYRHTTAPCHTSFPLSQDELDASASSSDNALSCCLPSHAETEALNSYHCHRLPVGEWVGYASTTSTVTPGNLQVKGSWIIVTTRRTEQRKKSWSSDPT
jgi:hypothetical protein